MNRLSIDELVKLIQADHKGRLDPPFSEVLVPRRTKRPRPKTAIISEAARRALEVRNDV